MHEAIVERGALPAGLEPIERFGPEGIIHRPKIEKSVVVEHPVEVRHERHVQPIVRERIHHVKPIVKAEATTEQRTIKEDHAVLFPPVMEPTAMIGSRAASRPSVT